MILTLRRTACISAVILLAQAAALPSAPRTPIRPVTETLHGVTITDPYRWLENTADPEVLAWMRAQRAHADAVLSMAPERAAIQAELEAITKMSAPRAGTLHRIGEGLIYLRRESGQTVWQLVMRERLDSPDRLLLDVKRMTAFGPAARVQFYPSPDARHVLLHVTTEGRGIGTIHVLDVATGALLAEAIPNAYDLGGTTNPWRPDGRAFVYRRIDDTPGRSPNQLEVGLPIRMHVLGTPASEDTSLFGAGVISGIELDPARWLSLEFSPGSPWALAAAHHAEGADLYVAPVASLAGPRTPWRRVATREDRISRQWALHGNTLYAMSSLHAPHFQVVKLALDTDAAAPRTLELALPEAEGVVLALFDASDALYVMRQHQAASEIARVPHDGSPTTMIRMPFTGARAYFGAASASTPGYVFEIGGWARSARMYFANGPGAPRLLDIIPAAESERALDVKTVEKTVEVEAKSADGTLVPMSIVYPRGMKRDGAHPARLGVYASHGVSTGPYYVPYLAPWFRRGGVHAECYARGGGERGPRWHIAGRGVNLPHRVADTIACAEYLVAEGYSSPGRIAALGVSAGGVAAGGAAIARPDLFGAAIMTSAVLDLLRAEYGRNGPVNVGEYGSTRTPGEFAAMRAISPVENVRPGVRYPAMLLEVGLNDRNVSPSHGAKLAARLQAASTSGRPVLLYANLNAGHTSPGPPLHDQLAFLLWQLAK